MLIRTEPQRYHLILADDDDDDCTFFKEALDDLPVSTLLTTFKNGVQLLKYLSDRTSDNLPDIVFLDLNMPLKSGFECLAEIKSIDSLKNLPVVIFSTSLDINIVDLLYEKGATFYIRKPGGFLKLKKAILQALVIPTQTNFKRPARDKFILQY